MNIETRHYLSFGDASHARWIPQLGQGHGLRNPDEPLPPSPGLILKQPPRQLYVRGRSEAFELLRWLPEFGFAVVGTRKPQARSIQLLRTRLRALEGTRLIIVSGLALGIDTAAHEAALDSRLPTIAVLGSSLEEVYPAENRGLADQIVKGGGLLATEFGQGTRIERHFFLLRNRLIAGWSKATWIVEAARRSGALNTANWAWDHDRDTYATPCFPGDPAHAGNQGLIHRDKAHAFWEPSSLKETWSEFKSLGVRRRIHPQPSLWTSAVYARAVRGSYNDGAVNSDAEQLIKEVARATIRQGGASVDFLLNWALAANWDPQRFFDTLQLCLQQQRIRDQNGILCSLGPASRSQ